ncbi:MAG TPA: hypothetical protein VFB43_08775 [Terracidiphilus sp.]|nr:hypothetical protein [Terracidiphilus sp.]
MGAFYVNYTVKGTDQNSVVRALSGRKAFVTPEWNGFTVVFDEESDKQDQGAIAKLAGQLSSDLRSTVLALLIHDSDIFWFQLYECGMLTDEYNSAPSYFSTNTGMAPPKGGNAERLCSAFQCKDVAKVERILRASYEEYPFAGDRHADLVRVLNLPTYAVGYGFRAVALEYLPEGLSAEDFVATN